MVAGTERPARFGEVLAVAEYRAVYAALTLSWLGDHFAKVALAVLIFKETGSALLSVTGFALGYLPWVAGGPILAALAERHPYRRVMVVCDVLRAVLVALMAFPGLPLVVLLALLLAASTLGPPFDAARSAQVAQLLSGDRYVLGLALQNTTYQAIQVAGYAAGGALAAISPRTALLLDAATFGLSAVLLSRGVRERPAAASEGPRAALLKETADGVRVVFGHPRMRSIALAVFALNAVVIVPEGLAVAWAAELGGGARTAGLLLAAYPVGHVAGGLVLGRLLSPPTRLRLIRPLLAAAPLLLLPALADPPAAVVFGLLTGAGVAGSVHLPLNGLFVQLVPDGFRARAFGVVRGGMQLVYLISMLASGALAEGLGVPAVVGVWAACGLLPILAVVLTWPGSGGGSGAGDD